MDDIPNWMQISGIFAGVILAVVAVLGGFFKVLDFVINAALNKQVLPELAEVKRDVAALKEDVATIKLGQTKILEAIASTKKETA